MIISLLKLLVYVAKGKKLFTFEIIFESLALGKFIDIQPLSWVLLFPPQIYIYMYYICVYIFIYKVYFYMYIFIYI